VIARFPSVIPRALLLAMVPLLGACATHSPMVAMSPVRQDALQVRDIDAPPSKTFSAATNALVNAGYTIQVTDGEGGLLTAWRREDPSIAKHAAVLTLTTLLTLGHAPTTAPPSYYATCVQILPRPNGLSQVRICLYGHANLKQEEALIDDLWISIQRDLLTRSRAPAP
jgi:hypothetical protein